MVIFVLSLTPTGENYQRLGLSSPGQVHGAKEISDYKMLHLYMKPRYGTSWTSWRQVGPDWTMATNQEKFTLLLDGNPTHI